MSGDLDMISYRMVMLFTKSIALYIYALHLHSSN